MINFEDVINKIGEFRLHPLGFLYLIDKNALGLGYRVHVWVKTQDTANQRVENAYHQHSFDMKSTILMGSLKNEIFQFVENPKGGEREFKTIYDDGRSILSPTGRTGFLETITSFESGAGDSYFLRAGVIHRASVTVKPCMTFLETEERNMPILCYGSDMAEQSFERRLVTPSEKHGITSLLKSFKK
jgi:hypothetical protein